MASNLRDAVLAWWKEHQYDTTGGDGEDDDERNLFDTEPEFVRIAKEANAKPGDNCEICHGAKGGVRGNENVIDGKVVCDYCHADGSYKEANAKP